MARKTKTAQGLTEKQERFCIEYVDNGGKAAQEFAQKHGLIFCEQFMTNKRKEGQL